MQTPQTRNKLTASIRASLLGTGAALALTFPASILAAGELDELKKQVEILMQKIETLEAQQKENKADLEKKVVTAGDTKGSYKLPGSNTSVQLGGYIKLDAIYDFDSDLGDTLGVGLVPVDGTETGSHFRAHARQSRLYLKTSTPLSNGKKVKTHFEGDFFV